GRVRDHAAARHREDLSRVSRRVDLLGRQPDGAARGSLHWPARERTAWSWHRSVRGQRDQPPSVMGGIGRMGRIGRMVALLAAIVAVPTIVGTQDEDTTAWVCPMHSDYTSEAQGTCPRCGMALVHAAPFDVRDYGLEFRTTPASVKPGQKASLRFRIMH